MRKLWLIALFVIGNMVTAAAQHYPDDETFKVGLNAGLNITTVTGSELKNPGPKYGFVVGMYYRQPLKKLRNNHLQVDLRAAFRGSTFSNEGEDHYRKMNLFYLDAPIMDYIQIGNEEKHFIIAGLQYSQLINSLIFLNPRGTNPISEGINLKNYDISALVGYHFNGYYSGWSLVLTSGLIDINNGLNLPTALPVTGTNKPIRNASFSILVYF